jgi:hypothetical protein
MKAETQSNALDAVWFFRSITVGGLGLLVMLADTDAGNVVTAAQSGAQGGYRRAPSVLHSLAGALSAARLVSRTDRRRLHDRLGGGHLRRRASVHVRYWLL